MSHTPGPWYYHFAACIEEQGTGDYVDATGICNASEEEFMKDGGRGDLVAFVPHDGPHQANARLIAAAPDLLAACKALAHDIRAFQFTDGEYRLSEDSARQILALLEREIGKAEGASDG